MFYKMMLETNTRHPMRPRLPTLALAYFLASFFSKELGLPTLPNAASYSSPPYHPKATHRLSSFS